MLNTLESVPLERPECAPALDDPDAGTWWIAFTKSNRHYDFVKLAARASIEFFLPMAERETRAPDGKRRVTSYPLFGAYCFIRGDKFMPAEALGTQMLRQIIPVIDQRRLRGDLANLERALNSRNGRRIERCEFAVQGRRVRVTEGSCRGVEGVVMDCGRGTLLVIHVEGILGGATMEIDVDKLEPVD